jgi:hypothetical protein
VTRYISASVDAPTARLLMVAQALELGGTIPVETARNLIRQARAIRLLCSIGEHAAAATLVERFEATVVALEDDDVSALVARHAPPLRTTLGKMPKVP